MKARTPLFLTASACALLCSANARAGTDDILNANNQFTVQALSTKVDYTEKDDTGTILDTENGKVPGYGASLSVMRDLLLGNDYLRLAYSRAKGNTDYVGSYIGSGSYGDVTATSGATITDYSLRLGRGFVLHPTLMLTPYVEFGHHEWKRMVNEGETYTNDYTGIGAMAQWSFVERLVLSANVLVGRTGSANIDVAGADGFSTALGSSAMRKLGLSLDYAFTPRVHGNVGMEYATYRYGRSANVRTMSGTYYEPASETKTTTVSAGLGYAF